MRLIDSETLAESYCKKMCAGKCSGKEKEKCKFMELLNEQPVAFDVDKVVERLEKEKEAHEILIQLATKVSAFTEKRQCETAVEVYDRAIEIVKGRWSGCRIFVNQ